MTTSSRFTRAIALSIAFLLLAALVIIAEIAQSGQKQIDDRIALSQKRQILLAELLEQHGNQIHGVPLFCAELGLRRTGGFAEIELGQQLFAQPSHHEAGRWLVCG